MKKVVLEGILIAFIGGLLALAGNAISPRGISLTQDFFHAGDRPRVTVSAVTPTASTNASTGASTNTVAAVQASATPASNELAATLKQEGLGLANTDRAIELFNDRAGRKIRWCSSMRATMRNTGRDTFRGRINSIITSKAPTNQVRT